MTTLQTTTDILNDVLFRAGEPTDGTSDFYTQALQYVNRAYRDIWMGGGALIEDMNEPWLWLKKDPPGTLTINPVWTDGAAVGVLNNSTITLSTVPVDGRGQNISLTGRFFKFDNFPDVFRITSHASGALTLTLDQPFTGPGQTGAARMMQLEYTLATDILRVISPMRVYAQNKYEIEGVDLISLERDQPLTYARSGTPTRFALVTEPNPGVAGPKIRFNYYGGVAVNEYMRVDYDYLAAPATDLVDDGGITSPLIPLVHRGVLADFALFFLLTAKSDLRAEGIGAQAKAGLRAMQKDNNARRAQMGRQVGAFITRPTKFNRFDRVLRTNSGLIVG